ncbi:CcdB family protein [Biformimicrobium ophioploci]|uniref:Toxin CcdB n=1 Tax=Biformimicrobium ophioploci TaxID=3036711 RepID=A0ABQ6LX27_9GAMM|nr:CcdB family protein [Microbulbifer sp. NKW57]GMG86562.1 CcdB family protein [Microbulbifer sp. NKW57]
MAQFDVYRNPSSRTRQMYPLLVDIQHDYLSDIATRIVIPLGRAEYFRGEGLGKLTPAIEYENESLFILIPQIASMESAKLNAPIGSLSHLRSEILGALDFAISGI